MKCTLTLGLTLVACLGAVACAFAQVDDYPGTTKYQGTKYQYSSYGYNDDAQTVLQDRIVQPPDQDADESPSDRAVPSPVPSSDPAGDCNCGSSPCTCGIYRPVVGKLHGNPARNRNWVFGVRGLIFDRDYEDDIGIGSNAAGEYLFSTTADAGTMGGVEFFLGARNCSGWGWQFSYWGLYPNQGDVTFNGPGLYTNLFGLGDLYFNPTGQDVQSIFNSADAWRMYRNNEIHNFEFNLLRNGGCVQGLCCKSVHLEWFAGLRFFRFDESLRLAAFNSNTAYPGQFNYDLETRNDLLGFQLGCRTERCLTQRLSLSIGTKFGVYNNDIYHQQFIADNNAQYAVINAGPYANTDYNITGNKDDVAVLGELDLGLLYQFTPCWRASIGYRALGVSGVALAPNQIPSNFTDPRDIGRIRSNCSLLLNGLYLGVERCF